MPYHIYLKPGDDIRGDVMSPPAYAGWIELIGVEFDPYPQPPRTASVRRQARTGITPGANVFTITCNPGSHMLMLLMYSRSSILLPLVKLHSAEGLCTVNKIEASNATVSDYEVVKDMRSNKDMVRVTFSSQSIRVLPYGRS